MIECFYFQVKENISAIWKQQNDEMKSQFNPMKSKLEQAREVFLYVLQLLL
jgi:hypothetical protein